MTVHVPLLPDGSRARRFVREALLSLGSDRPGFAEALRSVDDWDAVLSLARSAAVAESVRSALQLRGLEHQVPEPARTALRDAHESAVARNGVLLSEGAGFQEALAAAGVPSVVIKGPGLLLGHHPDPGARHVADVDVLVRPGDLDRAVEVARARGARVAEAPGLGYDGILRAGSALHRPFMRTADGVVLEVHGAIPGGKAGGEETEGVLSRRRAVDWEGRTLWVPALPDLVAGACIHVFNHHAGEERFLWRHLGDLATTIGAGATTWDEVREAARASGGDSAIDASRALLEVGRVPAVVLARCRVRFRVLRWQRDALEASGRGGALRLLVPAPRYMAEVYEVSPRSPVLPFLYVWRLVRSGWSAVTGR